MSGWWREEGLFWWVAVVLEWDESLGGGGGDRGVGGVRVGGLVGGGCVGMGGKALLVGVAINGYVGIG